MPRCPHCAHELAVPYPPQCPACGRDLRGMAAAATAIPAGTPRSDRDTVLAAGTPRSDRGTVLAAGTPRSDRDTVLAAGTPRSGINQSWMARLEAARQLASGTVTDEPASGAAPDLSAPRRAPRGPELQSKPAHLLVAQLEREEHLRQQHEAARLQTVYEEAAPEDEIARVEVQVATLKPPRRTPDWLWVTLVVALVIGGVGYAYTQAQREPVPTAELAPERVAAAARKKRALTALQNGHRAVLDEDHEAAIGHYREALRLEPKLASAERGLGIAFAAKGNGAAALKHYQRFLQLEPDGLEAAKIRSLIRDYQRNRRR